VPARRLVGDDEQAEGRHRFGLALELERRHGLGLDRLPHQGERLRAEQDLTGLCCLLQAGGDVDGIAGRKSLGRSGHDLARVQPDPGLQRELRQGLAHLHRCPAGS
jgi:hypothetical protein